ncbi:MAG: alpha-galactosidase, partial [Lachnospiraceae bacterium]|nr:alpha-galactosidase [Lachnospiraceae bacterium]
SCLRVVDVYSQAHAQGRVTYDYVLGVYDFLEKLGKRYPHMLIEGCSGGGGRFDAGMMYYTTQIWCSDNTDAIDRLSIQYGTSFFYPLTTVGAHVSAVPNHQTGRNVSLHTRGVVAMAGTFGYELDLRKLTEAEKEEIAKQVRRYREEEELVRLGAYYRLSNPDQDSYAAWLLVSQDKEKALLSVVMVETHGNMAVRYVKLRGLSADAVYEDVETGKRYNGMALMKGGLPLPVEQKEYAAYQVALKRVCE